MNRTTLIIIAIVIIVVFILSCGRSNAHEEVNPVNGQTMSYETGCCSDIDCSPAPTGSVTRNLDTGEYIYKYQFASGKSGQCVFPADIGQCGEPGNNLASSNNCTRMSTDGRYHACGTEGRPCRCLYVIQPGL